MVSKASQPRQYAEAVKETFQFWAYASRRAGTMEWHLDML